MAGDRCTPTIHDWFGHGDTRQRQVKPAKLVAFGIKVTSTKGDATELRELLQFASTLALWGSEHCVVTANYDDSATCTIAVRSRTLPADIDSVHRAAALSLTRFAIAGDRTTRYGRTTEFARHLLASVMKVGRQAFDVDDLARLVDLANDEIGTQVISAEVAALFDRFGARLTAIVSAMHDAGTLAKQERHH
jgi:hypothetical protein